ncbi:MAG TPA: glycosyltransferase family 4 protein, partial [Myxococcales bacterium]|nr:glycosyltransferase family 4 protein [Myxococcales bacterium]
VGGVWTYALELARGLAEQGVEVALATMGAPLDEPQREMAGRIPHLKVFESTFKLEWMEDPWRDVERAGDWLLGLEERFAPDLIHLNGYAHGALPWSAPKIVVGHSCVLSWWEAVKRTPLPPEWLRYRNAVRSGIRGARALAAPSATMLRALEHHYGAVPFARVIYNGRALPGGGAGAGRGEPKEPLILAAGRLWDEAKNVGLLGQVASRLPWPVVVAGESRGADLGGVRLLGRLEADDLLGWMRRAAIYALPARYEPFGLSILEAALSGCALVLGDIPSQRELWGGAAELVPPDDADALAFALNQLARDPERRAGLAAAARRRAARYGPDRMAVAYFELYSELVHSTTRITELFDPCASSSSATH